MCGALRLALAVRRNYVRFLLSRSCGLLRRVVAGQGGGRVRGLSRKEPRREGRGPVDRPGRAGGWAVSQSGLPGEGELPRSRWRAARVSGREKTVGRGIQGPSALVGVRSAVPVVEPVAWVGVFN